MATWIKVAIGAVLGGTAIVGGTVLAAMLVDVMDGTMSAWAALIPVLRIMWLLAMVVCGIVYWMHSPKGREVWTDEQRQALSDLKGGKL